MAITQRGTALYAADGATGDLFGLSSAVSADGAVLVVGAPFRDDGALTNSGGVYVYDWSGSAWVARGSVLTTAEDYARFGLGVALSSDGLVLAVGAPEAAHGAYYGIVYIYDWNAGSSAWVLRGTVSEATAYGLDYGSIIALSGDGLVLAVNDSSSVGFYIYDWDAGSSTWVLRVDRLTSPSYYSIVSSVALSYDGAILAAGDTSYSTGASNRGAVVLYDYAAGVWTERAALAVVASGYVANDFLGSSVALSSDGAKLYSGAYGRDTGGDNSGRVYVFDYAAGAWGGAGELAASDAAENDAFGSSLAVSSNGLVVAVGAPYWEGTAADQGAVYIFDVLADVVTAPTTLTVYTAPSGPVTAPTTLTVITAPSGPVTAPTTLLVLTAAPVSGPTSLSVIAPSGSVSAPTTLSVSASGSVSAQTLLAVIDAADAATWTATCLINGVDVSARLVGQASVTAEEGAARIAEITLLPASGTIDPLDYVGKTIVLDYVLLIGVVAVPRRLFTGRIDTPDYNPASTLLRLTCVDDLQNRVAVLPRAVIDGLIGGRYTEAVQGKIDDNWDYAVARLSTVAASLDAGASGGMRVTPWELATTWATYTEADLLYERATLTMPQRSTLVNHVDIEFDYRYPRLRQRFATAGWSGTQVDMAPNGYQYPTQQDILGAVGGTGWSVTLGVFYPAPASIPHPSGGFIYPQDGSIDMAILHLSQRHSQTVTEKYTLLVTADESVALNGTLPHALRGALESEFDGGAWESALDVAPLMPGGGEQDWSPDATRADADYAIDTLLAQARVKVLASHRGARVGNAVLCNPDLDVDKKVAIATAAVSAAGKVARVVHTLDFMVGSAVSEFDLAIFGSGGAGIITPDTLAPPAPPAEAAETQDWPASVPPLYVNTFGVTPYSDSIMGLLINPPETIMVENVPPDGGAQSFPNPFYVAGSYPVTGFRAQMPGVDDADRNPLEKLASASYSIIVPDDTMTFTVP